MSSHAQEKTPALFYFSKALAFCGNSWNIVIRTFFFGRRKCGENVRSSALPCFFRFSSFPAKRKRLVLAVPAKKTYAPAPLIAERSRATRIIRRALGSPKERVSRNVTNNSPFLGGIFLLFPRNA